MEDTKKNKDLEKKEEKKSGTRLIPTYGRLFGAAESHGIDPILPPSEVIDFSKGTDSTP